MFFKADIVETLIALSAFERKADVDLEAQWRMTRQICYYAVAPHTKRRIRQPSALFSLPWDKKGSGKVKPAEIPLEKKAALGKLFDLADKHVKKHGKPQ